MTPRALLKPVIVAATAAAAVLSAPALATARVHVFIGGGFGVPLYPYPAPYYYPYPYPAPGVIAPAAPPPGWVPGHWEERYDSTDRRYRVWVPAHLD